MKFAKICRMSQMNLKKYLAKRLKESYETVVSEDGFVYADGKFPVLLVAHLDTVHKQLPEHIVYENKGNKVSSPTGIGGDDRCGVYMILEVIKRYNCSVLFCEDEEIGGIGAEKFVSSDVAQGLKFNYIIEFDRRGSKDAVFYNCGNDKFEEFITRDFYEKEYGSFSDISIIAPRLGCAAVNLSCGYHSAHTTQEYVMMSEMRKSIEEACKILERTKESDVFEYIAKYSYNSYNSYRGYYGGWDDDDDDYGYGNNNAYSMRYYVIEYTDAKGHTQWDDYVAKSYEEAVGKFCIDHSDRTFKDIVDIMNMSSAYY